MPPQVKTTKLFPFEATLAVAATPDEITLGAMAKFVEIGYLDLDCYIAKSAAELSLTADGSADGRIFIQAGTIGRVFPWGSSSIFFVNSTLGETPTIYGVGLV